MAFGGRDRSMLRTGLIALVLSRRGFYVSSLLSLSKHGLLAYDARPRSFSSVPSFGLNLIVYSANELVVPITIHF